MLFQAVTTIPVRNLDASIAFYRGVLGLQIVHRVENEFVHLSGSGMMIALHPRDENVAWTESPNMHIGLTVADLEETRMELENRGVVFIGEPVDAQVAKLAFFNDPDGTPFYLCQWTDWRETRTSKPTYDLAAF